MKLAVNSLDRSEKMFLFGSRQISAEDFGNMHFGYLCGAIMLPQHVATAGSTLYAAWSWLSTGIKKRQFESIGSAYKRETIGRPMVRYGANLYGSTRGKKWIFPDSQINRYIYDGKVVL